jgi:hypothetical protein
LESEDRSDVLFTIKVFVLTFQVKSMAAVNIIHDKCVREVQIRGYNITEDVLEVARYYGRRNIPVRLAFAMITDTAPWV